MVGEPDPLHGHAPYVAVSCKDIIQLVLDHHEFVRRHIFFDRLVGIIFHKPKQLFSSQETGHIKITDDKTRDRLMSECVHNVCKLSIP